MDPRPQRTATGPLSAPLHVSRSALRCIGLVGVVLSGLLLVVAPASGQQSRAEDIAQQQAEKSRQLRPNTTSNVERALDWFEDHFTDPTTLYLTFGDVYPSSGFSIAPAYRAAFGHARLNVRGGYSVRSYKLAHVGLRFPALVGNRLDVELQARWTDATQVPYYGRGNDSLQDARVNYQLEALDLRGSATFKPTSWYRMGGGIAARRLEDAPGRGSRPSIETVHSSATAPGLFTESRYLQATGFTAVDWRESPGYTRRGGLYALAFHEFLDRDDRTGFSRVDAEIRHYVPLLKEQWVLTFRALAQTTTAHRGQNVPYHLLPSLGGARMHRGYADFRFQDRHLLLLSGEYRWLPSRVLDMALFIDAGKVTAERRDLDLHGLKTAFGIGARFHGPTTTPLRIDVARGDEGFRVHITGGLAF